MAQWSPFPYPGHYQFNASTLPKQWARLHAGDAEPLPQNEAALHAWVLLHNGHFEQAAQAGFAAGGAGTTAAHQATAIYANYLEEKEKTRQDLFMQVVLSAQAQAVAEPHNANAWYWHAYALSRYSQGISVAKALAQGLGNKIKDSLHRVIVLSPQHADARIALGAFHAEVIDKVGMLIGGMTYGAKKEVSLKLLQEALQMNPGSAIARIEYANALVMLEGDKRTQEATALYEQAAATEPLDATQRLDIEMARVELED